MRSGRPRIKWKDTIVGISQQRGRTTAKIYLALSDCTFTPVSLHCTPTMRSI